jgi:hypothetical protein
MDNAPHVLPCPYSPLLRGAHSHHRRVSETQAHPTLQLVVLASDDPHKFEGPSELLPSLQNLSEARVPPWWHDAAEENKGQNQSGDSRRLSQGVFPLIKRDSPL